ncbi:hypothetical protein [Roseivirga pacifica]
MKDDEIIDRILKFYKGSWVYVDSELDSEYHLDIGDTNVHLIISKDGEVVTDEVFKNSGHFFGHYYTFLNESNYVIGDATDNQLIFGKQKGGLMGDFEWSYKFERK